MEYNAYSVSRDTRSDSITDRAQDSRGLNLLDLGGKIGNAADTGDRSPTDNKHRDGDTSKSAADKSDTAYDEYARNLKLTPELKKKFEDSIADSDKGPSPKLPAAEKRYKEATDALDKEFPEKVQKEVQGLLAAVTAKMNAAPEAQSKELAEVMQKARSGKPEDVERAQKATDAFMKKAAPDEMAKLEKLLTPLKPLVDNAQTASDDLFREKYQSLHARMNYAKVLLHAGEANAAKNLVIEAVRKHPEMIDNPMLKDYYKRLDINPKEILKK